MKKNPCTIIVVRHAQTDGNLQRRVFGNVELPINEAGRTQAEGLRAVLSGRTVDVCVSSPMNRCLETAEILWNGAILVDERLTERGYGEKEGASFDEVDYLRFWNLNNEIMYDGAEALTAIRARVEDFLRDMAESHAGKTVMVITHGSVARTMRGVIAGQDFDGNYAVLPRVGNCEVLEFSVG
ncbi:MAG: histidine phosphatase family protein [Firmicutes bacterium]|nr:histidine phosphatase family protein [Bacillota bacterium]